jgi:plasmid stabilization system protein ParE
VTRIVWTLQAVEDVEAIRDYVARDSVHSAQLLASRLILSVERLAQFPDSGRIVPEVGDETIREVVLGNYRIVYRLAARVVPRFLWKLADVASGCRLAA